MRVLVFVPVKGFKRREGGASGGNAFPHTFGALPAAIEAIAQVVAIVAIVAVTATIARNAIAAV